MMDRTKTEKMIDMVHSIMSDLGPSVYKTYAPIVSKVAISLIKTTLGENLIPRVGPQLPDVKAASDDTSKPSPVMILSGTIPFRYKGGEEYHAPIDICFPPVYLEWKSLVINVVPIPGYMQINQKLSYRQLQTKHPKYVGMYLDGVTGKVGNIPVRITLNASIMEVVKFFSGEEPPLYATGPASPSTAPHFPYFRARAPPAPAPTANDGDGNNTHREEEEEEEGSSLKSQDESELPSELMCPLTHELMKCPVVTDDGQVYDKDAIEKWFQQFPAHKKPRSPNTNLELSSRSLFWSFSLKIKCDAFRRRKGKTYVSKRLSKRRRRRSS